MGRIKTSPNYLDYLCKNVFAMMKQLGPLKFFVTFITSVNYALSIREVRNDHVTCTCCCEHKMNSFRILLKATNMLFGKINDFFFSLNFKHVDYHMIMDCYG